MTVAHRAMALIALLAVVGACTSSTIDEESATPPTSQPVAPSSTAAVEVPVSQTTPAVPSTTEQAETLGPLGSTDREIETDDGLVDIGDAELPASLPEEFPVPDDFEVQLATDVGDQSGFSGVTALELKELADFYRTELDAQGYTVDEIQSIDGVLVVLGFDGDGGRGQVALSSAPGGGRSVLVTFSA